MRISLLPRRVSGDLRSALSHKKIYRVRFKFLQEFYYCGFFIFSGNTWRGNYLLRFSIQIVYHYKKR